jgi:hypothetical protein
MEKIKLAVLENTYAQVGTLMLFATIAVVAPFAHNQIVTGTIVNAVLFLSVMLFGFRKASVVAIAPSIVSFAIGLFPVSLAFFVPYIIVSNLVLMGNYAALSGARKSIRIGTSVLLKFAFLFATSQVFFHGFMGQAISSAFAASMSYPQLITAALGGILAFGIAKLLQK